MFPIDIGSSLASGLVGIGQSFLSNKINRDNMKYQQELAKDLMNYQWSRFQSPSAQVNAMTAAGINPALQFGSAQGQTATPAPSFTTSAPVQLDGITPLLSTLKTISEAKKVGAEEVGQVLQNKLLSDTFSEQVKAVGLKNNWTETETSKMEREIDQIVGNLNLMHNQGELQQKQIKWFDRHMSAEVDDLKQSAAYHEALKNLTESQQELLDRTMDDLCDYTNFNADYMQKLVNLLDKYGDAQAIVGMVSQVVSAASDFIGNFIPSKTIKHVVENVTHPAK